MTDTIPPASDKAGQAHRRVGAYAKLLANYASDDAIIEAGEAAELLFVRGLAFCATSDSDGFITDAQVVRYVGAGMKDAPRRAAKLAAVGVWERLDGGYLVRSWTKIHETAASKGRRRKADRERKRKPAGDSDGPSARNPDGIQTEGVSDSLSMTEQCSDTTVQSTTGQVVGSEEGHRSEPLRVVPATEHTTEANAPEDARCIGHRGVAEPGPCRGCQLAREKAQRVVDADQERAKRDAERRARDCNRCDGVHVVDDNRSPTRRLCDHRRTA